MSNNTNMFSKVLESLKAVATVPVEVDGVETKNKITLSRLRMEEILRAYERVYVLVNKCWSNLPDAPCDEKTYLFVWIMACDGYCINYRTISWEGASPNTFVHVWSIMDRIRMTLENSDLAWVVGTRNCPEFCRFTDMSGAVDQYLYQREPMVPDQIAKMEMDVFKPGFVNERVEFCSYYDFCMDTLVDSGPKKVDISEMAMMNDEIARMNSNN